ncbi:enoyl-CoA hydratase/isomerase family protein [Streptomyces sp. TG1A-8]|uniref:enoyl-CoA hydratase/isomerase family protein n=1 Tax=Streptomyces sp. TG1A-8 TaxID=3051385 RepID=UPI00265C4863|nr:enoyl-CoA hydratase/isomerase family protein [Streptomyces sp. TG1A-8]MDO0926324.1 enoyl-CoA hydratase/isomerase family protein [Streptomyces sp. TG1A-8]
MADTRELARKLGGLAGELGTAVRELERIECGAWKGKTAVAFVEYVGKDVTPLLRKSHDSFEKASRALHRWAKELQAFQDETDRLDKAAGQKLDAESQARAEAGGKGSQELGKASGAVDKVISDVHDLEERFHKAAREISKELDKAGDIAPDEPGFWDKLGKGIENAWDATGDWLKDHADLIKLVGDLLSDVSGILGMLAILTLPFEPLGAIFGAAALLTSGLALLSHSIAKAAGGDVSWMQMGFDALGLLPGLGAFGKGVKVVDEGVAAARAAGEFGKGFQGAKLASGARNLFATGDLAGKVDGGLALLGKRVVLGGKYGDIGIITHESGAMNRLAGLAEAGYHQGQMIGSKGLKIVSGGKIDVHPLSMKGIALDATLKVLPKTFSIPQHIGEALHPGDSFHDAATSH